MLRILFVILLFVLTSCHPSQKEDVESFDIPLIQQNRQFLLSGEYDSLIHLNKKYYQLAEKMHYDDGKALCYINLAYANYRMREYQNSRVLFEYAEKILEHSESNIHKAIFYIEYSEFKRDVSGYDAFSKYSDIALDYAKNSNDSWLRNYIFFKIYIRRGNLYVDIGQYEKALEYYRQSQKLNEPELLDINIGSFYLYHTKNIDSAQIYLTRAMQVYSKKKDKNINTADAYSTMGKYYTKVENYDEAEKMYAKALEIDKKTRRIFPYFTTDLYREMRLLYEDKGDPEKAYFYLKAFNESKNKTTITLLPAMGRNINEFLHEADKSVQKDRNAVFVLILMGLTVFAFSGIYSWHVISLLRKKKIKLKTEAEKLKGQMDNTVRQRAIELAKQNDPSFLQVFRDAYPGFVEKVLKIDPDLEDSELIFCAMLKLHFSSKEIAGYTSIQHRTVQQKKYRIRKKLNIPQDTDTYLFFDQLT